MTTIKTAEQIARIAEQRATTAIGERRIINAEYRQQDESHLWPISERFNVTDRAIRRVNQFERANGAIGGLEYCYVLEQEMSNIVNGAV